ncbi:MAG: GDP-L-fucose synthase [Chloroflexota bacterium]|nr:GDP-L-fucose synthase [Chloroflexota bacterium]
MLDKNAKIYIAGHKGLVGSGFKRRLQANGFNNLLLRDHSDLDLIRQNLVDRFFDTERPEYVLLAAARVGGIMANSTYPANFIHENLAIQTNVVNAAFKYGVARLIFLGSSCIYPRDCAQPIKEDYLLTGPLEQSNAPYSIAKIAGIELCRAYNRQHHTKFLSVMPSNLYGPGDNYDLADSHVLPALLRKTHEAKESGSSTVEIWGTGQPRREFLYVDDMVDACIHLLNLETQKLQNILDDDEAPGLLNIGYGEDLTISELVEKIAETVGFKGDVVCDTDKPDGTPRKILDGERIRNLGWKPSTTLQEGLRLTYESFLHEQSLA